MITNERQYKITKAQASKFDKAIKEFNELALIEQGLDPVLVQAQRNALKSQLKELTSQIEAYEALKSGQVRNLSANTISQLGLRLIEARIAQGLTQKELADRLQMKEQQIQRYETERYSSASLMRLAEVSGALDVNFQLEMRLDSQPESAQRTPSAQSISLDKFPVKTIRQRKWLDSLPPTSNDTNQSFEEKLVFFLQPALRDASPALLRQGVRLDGEFDEHALLAWKARVAWRARQQPALPAANFSDLSWLKTFKEFTLQKNGPALAIEYLETKGIHVVIEGHLPKTHLDGAAFLVDQNTLTIGLTLRHDRLDNFWFVLLHELGHLVQHRESGLKRGFFDNDQVGAVDKLEKEADEFAKSILLPAELWLTSLIRFTQSAEQIYAFAEAHRISPAIVAGWIRRERSDYTIFNDLVGYGKVKRTLKAAGLLEAANVSGI